MNRNNFKKKGAMFGLDARIALAIFGALSIISGAALYSVISKVQTASIVQSFEAFSKAYISMYIDTSEHTSGCHIFKNEPVHIGWSGPYLSGSCTAANGPFYFDDPLYNKLLDREGTNPSKGIFYKEMINSTWGSQTWISANCISQEDCGIYYKGYIPQLWSLDISLVNNIFIELDNYIDGGDGDLSGKFRYSTTGVYYSWAYKIMVK